VAKSTAMKLLALLALFAAACGSSSPSTADAGTPVCPQHRVEDVECPSTTSADGVLHKDGHICGTCVGHDSTGQLTAQPVGCTTVAGDDLCVADCSACS
jgi:hypothetical protein